MTGLIYVTDDDGCALSYKQPRDCFSNSLRRAADDCHFVFKLCHEVMLVVAGYFGCGPGVPRDIARQVPVELALGKVPLSVDATELVAIAAHENWLKREVRQGLVNHHVAAAARIARGLIDFEFKV